MIQFFLHYLMIMINFLFFKMNHPMSMGFMLLLQTLIISMMSSMINSWYSYMLFIIFIGGMLVLFIYVTSLASNEIFTFNINMIYFMIFLSFMFMMIYLYSDNFMFNKLMNMETQLNNNMMTHENLFSLMKLYNFPTNMLSIMMMIYLFIALIASVKITNLSKGPLRQMFN